MHRALNRERRIEEFFYTPNQFIWLADIHLNFLDDQTLARFINRLAKKKPDGIIIAGDIGEADSLMQYLAMLSDKIACSIYFVLGNHDYYRGSIDHVRSELIELVKGRSNLKWLNTCEAISISPTTALIGHDSWADGRLGNYWKSEVQLNDFVLIGDFIGRTKQECLNRMMSLADEAAAHFRRALPLALEKHNKVIIVTHVPPFAASALYRGKVCEPDWLPFFSCKAVGDVLVSVMAAHPDKEALVYCGHTHSSAAFSALPNLRVITGAAVYGRPTIHKEIIID